jgi:hypothetical protein
VMQCPRQYFGLRRNEKGSMPPRGILPGVVDALKRGSCGGRSCSRGRGGPPDFPRHRRPRCIAPRGGVVWLCVAAVGFATSAVCRMPMSLRAGR